jgi:valyl-tRNA synthetase
VFVHPRDPRYRELIGATVTVPLFGQQVPVIADPGADPDKGTGAVMCCTFGDAADVEWWRAHGLPRVQVLGPDGRLAGDAAGPYAGLTTVQARARIVEALDERGEITDRAPLAQSVRVHERCDTPVEYLVTRQWFVRVLDSAEALLSAGDAVSWHPEHMRRRYQEWAENLAWDWCISRQRYFGVPFPVWLCDDCGGVVVADGSMLPVDPEVDAPPRSCACGSDALRPEPDVMDTWATSSLTPQIAGRWHEDPDLYDLVFPFSLRPQAHEIIRTWAFYTIARSHFHFGAVPWSDAMISGWGIAPEGSGKISKSRGGGPMAPDEMIERYSADAVRYWAASTGLGKDAVISEEKVQSGAKLVTKLWNVARLAERFLDGYVPPAEVPPLSPADRWILSRLQELVARATDAFEAFDYASALHSTEAFFWRDLADNYLEMSKGRLYEGDRRSSDGARYGLHNALLCTLKLFAPVLPHVTDVIYRELFAAAEGTVSIHRAVWPEPDPRLTDPGADTVGEVLVGIASLVRRYKSENGLSLGSQVAALRLTTGRSTLAEALTEAHADLASVTRALEIEVLCDGAGGGLSPDTSPGMSREASPGMSPGMSSDMSADVSPGVDEFVALGDAGSAVAGETGAVSVSVLPGPAAD